MASSASRLFGERHEQLSLPVFAAPALQRGDDVFGRDRLAVVPRKAVAQREGVLQGVVAHLPGVHHLRLDVQVLVQGEQHVVDHVTVVAGDVGGGPDGVNDLEVGVRDEFERAARFGVVSQGSGERAGTEAGEQGNGEDSVPLAANLFQGGFPFFVRRRCPAHVTVVRP